MRVIFDQKIDIGGSFLGSARVSRVGERVLAIADFFLEFSFLPIDTSSWISFLAPAAISLHA